ncbi:NAD(P)-dependent oxidoreductase [Streptomyces luteolifulvus]|jgi:citronellol/citronellal dehydrogenase|uniref:NAD(P)-dependent oxidoreductase n=1 Tax=Streptomyces luteolifulvus TaxID=2615112 RepID=A0A6H9UT30_9ACTN|nr:NAD(P)-dependent oxidoreductase [Streptomyces luteolifulvus]KAB1141714.1 NAD(P)-dependent oxidoreductase [Streptomyces luteolifulvus]
MTAMKDKTLFITGGSRGIGRAIALRAAAEGANVVIAAKTAEPHPKLPGTIHTVAAEIEAAGGRALPLALDVREEDQVAEAVASAAHHFGGIDVLVNNASAVFLAKTAETPLKRFDLMFDINVRGTFAASQACIPYLERSENGHILTMSPPIDLHPGWFAGRSAYTMSKFAMSMTVLGLAEELRASNVAVNALWPRTMIYTAASAIFGLDRAGCRSTGIMADAAHAILTRPSAECTGNFFLDEEVLREEGVTDFAKYELVPGTPPEIDLFVTP